ncbi:MAG: hypothetical protein JWO20_3256 [Candidatus Angelobacter sp.]|jgi:hypothetical protein|nr:hypothetical protein [Candidatus Angelobacter sp.]
MGRAGVFLASSLLGAVLCNSVLLFAQTIERPTRPSRATSVIGTPIIGTSSDSVRLTSTGIVFPDGTIQTTAVNGVLANGVRMANQFPGSDCGEKINAADADLGTSAGEIWVSQACGLAISTAVSISANHTLRWVQGGTYTQSATITLGANAGMVGAPSAMAIGLAVQTQVMLKQADGANLAAMINAAGGFNVIQDMTVDGNKAKNLSAGPNILINQANRVEIMRVTTQNSNSHGIQFTSSTFGKESCCGKMTKLMSISNSGNGIYALNTSDLFVTMSEIENNSQNGIELMDSPAMRLENSDIGGNGLDGVFVHASGTGIQSVGQIIVGNQFGYGYRHDIHIVGNVGSTTTSLVNSIVANSFLASANRTPNNTYDDILLVDGGQNVITGNFFGSSASPHAAKYAVEVTETASGRAYPSVIQANSYTTNFGSGAVSDTTQHGYGTITNTLRTSATLAFPAISPNSCTEQGIGIGSGVGSQALMTGIATASPNADLGNGNLVWSARVAALNRVNVRLCNPTSGSITPVSVAWNVAVVQ